MYAVFDYSRNSHDKKVYTNEDYEACESFVKTHKSKNTTLKICEYNALDYQNMMREQLYSQD